MGHARVGVIGPNAAIQLAAALHARGLAAVAEAAFAEAGRAAWLTTPPTAMIPQDDAARIFGAVYARLPRAAATEVAAEAGKRTGAYILANRIPPLARQVLPHLPRALSRRALLRAIRGAAWTFVGSGRCAVWAGYDLGRIEISANPLRLPGGPWHVGVFSVLFRALVDPQANVRAACEADGDCAACRRPACVFNVRGAT